MYNILNLDGSTGKNFGLLIIDELNRRGFTTGTGNSSENKVDRARRVSADIQLNGIYLVGKDRTGFTKKWAMEFLEKITAYPNEAIHDDCVVAFTGGYEKIATEKQPQEELMWINGTPHNYSYFLARFFNIFNILFSLILNS